MKSLSRKQTVYSFVLSLLVIASTALPFQYLPNNTITLFTSMFGTRSLQPLTFINTISGQISSGGFGYIIAQVLCYSILSFVIASLLYGILNFVLLLNPHNLVLIAFRNYCAYMYLSISIIASTTISVWAIVSLFLYGPEIVLTFGIALSFISLLAFTQTTVCISCLKHSTVKLELNAYEKTKTAQI